MMKCLPSDSEVLPLPINDYPGPLWGSYELSTLDRDRNGDRQKSKLNVDVYSGGTGTGHCGVRAEYSNQNARFHDTIIKGKKVRFVVVCGLVKQELPMSIQFLKR